MPFKISRYCTATNLVSLCRSIRCSNSLYAVNQDKNIFPDQDIDVHCEGNTSNDSVGHIRMHSSSEGEFTQEFVRYSGKFDPASIIGDGSYDYVTIRCEPFKSGSVEHITLKDGELVSVVCR